MNETIGSILRRRSIRRFASEDIGQDSIATLLEAANSAPSAHNQQSWRFIVLRGEKKTGLADLVRDRSRDFTRPTSSLLRMAARSIASAPAVIAVANTGELIEHGRELFNTDIETDFLRTMEIQSSAAAVENLLIAATSLGIASVWLGILFLIKDEVLEYLGEPKGEFMAVVPIGYPLRDGKGPEKKPLSYVVKELD